jgi:hypothetical protein
MRFHRCGHLVERQGCLPHYIDSRSRDVTTKDFDKMNIFEKMPPTERSKAADSILPASEFMTVEERRTLIASLTDSLAGDIQAKGGGDEKRKTVITNCMRHAHALQGVASIWNTSTIRCAAIAPDADRRNCGEAATRDRPDFSRRRRSFRSSSALRFAVCCIGSVRCARKLIRRVWVRRDGVGLLDIPRTPWR